MSKIKLIVFLREGEAEDLPFSSCDDCDNEEVMDSVHVADISNNIGFTICGAAWDDQPAKELKKGKVTCKACIAIIEYCKSIDSRRLKKD